MTKIVITGAGQDSSYMAEFLIAQTAHEIVVATRRTSHDNLGNFAQVIDNPRFRITTLDLNDPCSITSLIRDERPDYLINLGGVTFVPDGWNSPAQTIQTNAIALIHILEAVRQYNPDCRVFSAGSSEQDNHSIYGISKAMAQRICESYSKQYGLYVVHGIFGNHESPRRADVFLSKKVAKGVARIAKAIKEGVPFAPLEVGNLDATRDFSYAPDLMPGIWAMLSQNGEAKGYTLCSGEHHSVRELIETAFEAAGIQGIWWTGLNETRSSEEYLLSRDGLLATKAYTPLVKINSVYYRPTDPNPWRGDPIPARTDLGWTVKTSFREMVKIMVENEMGLV